MTVHTGPIPNRHFGGSLGSQARSRLWYAHAISSKYHVHFLILGSAAWVCTAPTLTGFPLQTGYDPALRILRSTSGQLRTSRRARVGNYRVAIIAWRRSSGGGDGPAHGAMAARFDGPSRVRWAVWGEGKMGIVWSAGRADVDHGGMIAEDWKRSRRRYVPCSSDNSHLWGVAAASAWKKQDGLQAALERRRLNQSLIRRDKSHPFPPFSLFCSFEYILREERYWDTRSLSLPLRLAARHRLR